VDDVDDDNPSVNFQFKFSRPSGRHVVRLENIDKSYPDLQILKNAEGVIEKGDKIALIGANGKGKSTLLRLIAGADQQFSGTSTTGHNVSQTFFAQHQLEALHLENTILQELQSFAPKHTETELRSILGCFLFTGDDSFKKIKVLSGGEKSRVALAKALTADANFLLLDEPTNHLDIQSVNILIQALQQFEGTFIVISHDRYLLDNVANKIWYIEDHLIKEYPGTYEEYEEWQSKRPAKSKEAKVEKKETKAEPVKKDPTEEQARNKQLQTLNKSLLQIESSIAQEETKLLELEQQLADDAVLSNPADLAAKSKAYEVVKDAIQNKQKEWDILAEEIMRLETVA
jgi:ATP-binding cassette subfamily F protein 3